MANPYKYTSSEVDAMVEQWHKDDFMVYNLKDFIMWETRFSEEEFELWARTGAVPNG